MKIAVDAGCLGIQDERLKVGVFTVVKNLLIELGKLDKKNQYYLYSFYPIEKSLMKKFGNNMHNIVILSKGWLQISLPLRLLFDKPDIFVAANQAMPFKFLGAHYKTLGIFYDIAFEKYPELYAYAASVEKHKKNSRNLAKHADICICISQNTKKDIIKLYGVSSEKCIVAYPGVERKWNKITTPVSQLVRNDKKNPYFLFVGAFKKSKNIPFLVRSFVQFLKNTSLPFDLLLVGGDKWLDPEITATIHTIPQEFLKHIKFLGFVDSQKLSALYKKAYALVNPSLYEGFGLSFIEAQQVGIPVIGSLGSSAKEVIGDGGLLVNPRNSITLVRALIRLSEDTVLYKKLSIAAFENAKRYSWKNFAKQVESAIQALV